MHARQLSCDPFSRGAWRMGLADVVDSWRRKTTTVWYSHAERIQVLPPQGQKGGELSLCRSVVLSIAESTTRLTCFILTRVLTWSLLINSPNVGLAPYCCSGRLRFLTGSVADGLAGWSFRLVCWCSSQFDALLPEQLASFCSDEYLT